MGTTTANPLIDHPGLWRGEELWRREDWEVKLSGAEIHQLKSAVENSACKEEESITKEDFALGSLAGRLETVQRQLEEGAGFVFVRGLLADQFDEDQLRRVFWGVAVHLGTPVSQSAAGERIFSCLLYTSPSPRDKRQSRMPSSA